MGIIWSEYSRIKTIIILPELATFRVIIHLQTYIWLGGALDFFT